MNNYPFIFIFLITLASPAGAAWLDNWEMRNSPVPVSLFFGLTYGNGTFVAVGTFYEGAPHYTWRPVVLTSSNGNFWSSQSFPTNAPRSVAYGNGRFVSVGGLAGPSHIATSAGGVTWTLINPPANALFLEAVSFVNGRFVAVGSNGTVFTSENGIDWTERHYVHAEYLNGVAYGNGAFVAVGWAYDNFTRNNHRLTVYSRNGGITWYGSRSFTANLTFNAVTFTNGVFLAVGDGGITALSTNGTSWFDHWSGVSNALHGVTYYDGSYVAVGANGMILSSIDGLSWTQRGSGSTNKIMAIAPGNLTLVAVGNYIVQSVYTKFVGKQSEAAGFELNYTSGDFGAPVRIQASSDLSNFSWVDLFTFTNSAGTNRFFDLDARALSKRFYRISSP
jgi:hypothetical protein